MVPLLPKELEASDGGVAVELLLEYLELGSHRRNVDHFMAICEGHDVVAVWEVGSPHVQTGVPLEGKIPLAGGGGEGESQGPERILTSLLGIVAETEPLEGDAADSVVRPGDGNSRREQVLDSRCLSVCECVTSPSETCTGHERDGSLLERAMFPLRESILIGLVRRAGRDVRGASRAKGAFVDDWGENTHGVSVVLMMYTGSGPSADAVVELVCIIRVNVSNDCYLGVVDPCLRVAVRVSELRIHFARFAHAVAKEGIEFAERVLVGLVVLRGTWNSGRISCTRPRPATCT